MIRLALGTFAMCGLCVAAVDASATRWAVPFGIVAALAGVLIVLRCDRPDQIGDEDLAVTPSPPLHERTDVELIWTDDSRIVGYHRKPEYRRAA